MFTLPHSLNALYGTHPRWVIDTLFACSAQTLAEFASNPKWMGLAGGTPAFSLVLHTWTQDLRLHIHLHAVMACGVLGTDGNGRGQWHMPTRKPDFLFPVQALSKVFRGKFMAALAAAHKAGRLERDPQGDDQSWRARQRQLYQHAWVVYAKTPLGGPTQVLEYLSRYTHRTAISNERIRSISEHEVAFSVRADDHGGKRLVRLDGAEFVRRFMLHILPSGIKLQGSQACNSPCSFADASAQLTGAGVRPGIHGAGSQARCGLVSVLRARSFAGNGGARRS